MIDPNEIPETAARVGAALDDYELDMTIAVTVARRDVAARYGYEATAEGWNQVLITLTDQRALRHAFASQLADLDCRRDLSWLS